MTANIKERKNQCEKIGVYKCISKNSNMSDLSFGYNSCVNSCAQPCENLVYDEERVDDIGFSGLRLIQKPDEFCYGVDAVILADFAAKCQPRTAIDLGTGTGIVPFILSHKTRAEKIVGLEVQAGSFDRACRGLVLNSFLHATSQVALHKKANKSIAQIVSANINVNENKNENANANANANANVNANTSENANPNVNANTSENANPNENKSIKSMSYNIENRITFIHGNVADKSIKSILLDEICAPEGVDLVTANPPYMISHGALISKNEAKAIARHEILAGLEDFVATAASLLHDRGHFYMVHRPSRLVDIIELARRYSLEPKELRMVCPSEGKEPNIVLVHCIKNAGAELKVLPQLYVYGEDGKYSDEIEAIYERNAD